MAVIEYLRARLMIKIASDCVVLLRYDKMILYCNVSLITVEVIISD